MNRIRSYSHIFGFFKDRTLNKRQKVFAVIGAVSFALLFFVEIVSAIYSSQVATNESAESFIRDFIYPIGGWGFFVGLLMFSLVSVEYIGNQFGKTTFFTSLLHVLGKVFKYMILPALIITALLILIL